MKTIGINLKSIAVLFLVVVMCFFIGCMYSRDNINITYGKSDKFCSDEIKNAIDCVIIKFNRDFRGCRLTDIWYDEDSSDLSVQSYLHYGRGSINNVEEKNVIVLLSNFNVDASGGDGSLEPNSKYTDWEWILIRNNKNDNWIIDDWGY